MFSTHFIAIHYHSPKVLVIFRSGVRQCLSYFLAIEIFSNLDYWNAPGCNKIMNISQNMHRRSLSTTLIVPRIHTKKLTPIWVIIYEYWHFKNSTILFELLSIYVIFYLKNFWSAVFLERDSLPLPEFAKFLWRHQILSVALKKESYPLCSLFPIWSCYLYFLFGRPNIFEMYCIIICNFKNFINTKMLPAISMDLSFKN